MDNQDTDIHKRDNSESEPDNERGLNYDKKVAFLANRINKNRNGFENRGLLTTSSNLRNPENVSTQKREGIMGGESQQHFQIEENFSGEIKKFEKLSADKQFQKRNRLDPTSVTLMVSVAILYDICQVGLNFIPVVGWILSSLLGIFAWLTFYIWTSIKGWGLSDTVKKWFVQIGLRSLDVIPVGNALPLSTVSVLLQISFLKAEDTLYNKTHGKVDVEQLAKLGKRYGEYYKKVA